MQTTDKSIQTEKATFAGGCFWCTEAIFQKLKGVSEVVSGYSGGHSDNPSYIDVSSGRTGHAEAIQITYDPKVITYEDLLYVFLKMIDPTTKDAQGVDMGREYRSIIFYADERQHEAGHKALELAQKEHNVPVVTELTPFKNFYKAEEYHQNFFNENKNPAYCRLVIDPKIEKLKKDFKEYLK